MSEVLVHNLQNAVTAEISRARYNGERAVKKRITAHNRPDTPAEWRAHQQPNHWNYWYREAEVYTSGLSVALADSGVRLPRLLAVENHDANNATLWLEEVQGRSGAALTRTDYVLIARAWGRAQALLQAQPWLDMTWTSRRFLRAYTSSKPVNFSLVDDVQAWQAELIRETWPQELAAGLRYLISQRERLYGVLEKSPQVPCHLDFWPHNVFVDEHAQVVPIDWAFFGSGALGEDIGNFIPDAVFDGFMPASAMLDAAEEMLQAYADGLRDGGVAVDEGQLRRNLYASAVKYVWLGPLLLARAQEPQQHAYGGVPLADARQQYAERGQALLYLCDWVRELDLP